MAESQSSTTEALAATLEALQRQALGRGGNCGGGRADDVLSALETVLGGQPSVPSALVAPNGLCRQPALDFGALADLLALQNARTMASLRRTEVPDTSTMVQSLFLQLQEQQQREQQQQQQQQRLVNEAVLAAVLSNNATDLLLSQQQARQRQSDSMAAAAAAAAAANHVGGLLLPTQSVGAQFGGIAGVTSSISAAAAAAAAAASSTPLATALSSPASVLAAMLPHQPPEQGRRVPFPPTFDDRSDHVRSSGVGSANHTLSHVLASLPHPSPPSSPTAAAVTAAASVSTPPGLTSNDTTKALETLGNTTLERRKANIPYFDASQLPDPDPITIASRRTRGGVTEP